MAPTPDQRLVAALVERFDVGPGLATAFLHHWQRTQGQSLDSLAEVDALQPPRSEWFADALGANRAGRELVETLAANLGRGSARLVDLGCGLGGRLVAGADRGWRVTGLETDAGRRRLAAANLRDHDLDPEKVLAHPSGGLLPEGTWDVVIALDPDRFMPEIVPGLRQLADTVAAGGLLVTRIANRTSLALARSDPRSGLLGAVLLNRDDRATMFASLGREIPAGATQRPSMVVREALDALGFEVERLVVEPWPERPLAATAGLITALLEAYGDFCAGPRRRLPTELAGALDAHLLALVHAAVSELSEVVAGSDREPVFRDRHLVDFETLLAVRR